MGATSKTNPAIVRTDAYAGSDAQMKAGDSYLLTCELSTRGEAVLHVWHWTGARFVDLHSEGYVGIAHAGIWVAPDDEVSIGKKPRDDTSGDTYAGDIDNIRISRWEPVTAS